MEQSRYLLWAKRKLPDSSNSYGDSWEEQAFAEDAAGPLGGCVWPPRSYSCSFCRREFRSAQALGGHMNVHRRDRARLKQSPAADVGAPQNHALNPCTFLYNNPNTNESVRVSSPPLMKVNNEEKTSTFSLFSGSPFVQKGNLNNIVRSPRHPSWSSFVAEKIDRNVLDSIKNKESTTRETEFRVEKEDCVTEDRLNLVVVCDQTQPNNTCSDEEVGSCKRRRIDQGDYLPKLSAIDRCIILPNPDFVEEELDLELRLGDAPKRDLMGVKIKGGYREGHMGHHIYVCF